MHFDIYCLPLIQHCFQTFSGTLNLMANLVSKDSADDDAWDDTLLIKAYDNSVKLAKEELAKRIAQSTNKAGSPGTLNETSISTGSEEHIFRVGDYVRATYEDGVDYEAKIMSINENMGTCSLKYVGYENEQEVNLADLVPTWGKKARRMQFAKSKQDPDVSNEPGNKENKKSKLRCGQTGDLPYTAVPPPPPMPPMLHDLNEESEHLSAMLMSWYMSGYYTGLYQGQKMSKNKARNSKK